MQIFYYVCLAVENHNTSWRTGLKTTNNAAVVRDRLCKWVRRHIIRYLQIIMFAFEKIFKKTTGLYTIVLCDKFKPYALGNVFDVLVCFNVSFRRLYHLLKTMPGMYTIHYPISLFPETISSITFVWVCVCVLITVKKNI